MRTLLARLTLTLGAAVYHGLFRLACRIAFEPAPVLTPDRPASPDPLAVLMALEAARRSAWLR